MSPCAKCVCGMTDAELQRCMINAALAPYGAELTADGRIAKGERVTSVRPYVRKGRIRFETENGALLFSGPPNAAAVSKFVESFWFWTRAGKRDNLLGEKQQ